MSIKKSLLSLFLVFFSLFPFIALNSCSQKIDYFDYLSELRDNLLYANTEELSLRIYSVKKETPYAMDGIKKECSKRAEIYLITPEGDKDCFISFTVNEKEYSGDMSYDNVKREYYFICSANLSMEKEIVCKIVYGEKELELCAKSVLDNQTLSPKNALSILVKEEKTLFTALTDKYGFLGEIHLRLIHEDGVYYYIGIIDKNKQTYAYLLNAKTGKILAKRKR